MAAAAGNSCASPSTFGRYSGRPATARRRSPRRTSSAAVRRGHVCCRPLSSTTPRMTPAQVRRSPSAPAFLRHADRTRRRALRARALAGLATSLRAQAIGGVRDRLRPSCRADRYVAHGVQRGRPASIWRRALSTCRSATLVQSGAIVARHEARVADRDEAGQCSPVGSSCGASPPRGLVIATRGYTAGETHTGAPWFRRGRFSGRAASRGLRSAS